MSTYAASPSGICRHYLKPFRFRWIYLSLFISVSKMQNTWPAVLLQQEDNICSMEVEFLAVSLALSIRKLLWIRVDTPVRQFTCKLAGKDSTFLPSFRHVKDCEEGIALWGNTMARKKKKHYSTYSHTHWPGKHKTPAKETKWRLQIDMAGSNLQDLVQKYLTVEALLCSSQP